MIPGQHVFGMYTIRWANGKMTRILVEQARLEEEIKHYTELAENHDKIPYGPPVAVEFEFGQDKLFK